MGDVARGFLGELLGREVLVFPRVVSPTRLALEVLPPRPGDGPETERVSPVRSFLRVMTRRRACLNGGAGVPSGAYRKSLGSDETRVKNSDEKCVSRCSRSQEGRTAAGDVASLGGPAFAVGGDGRCFRRGRRA